MYLLVKCDNPNLIPVQASSGAAGYDLKCSEGMIIPPRSRAVVGTGVAVRVPEGTYGRVAPRSGLALRNGIDVGGGVIDSDYTGEIKVILFNHSSEAFHMREGDRIAQLILERIVTPHVRMVDTLKSTQRGEKGFGSTGN
jgi:dUTP pyrophosphatase